MVRCKQILSAISDDATVICCRGSSADFVKVLDKNLAGKAGVQYPFTLTRLQFERLLHKLSFRVKGRIDMFSMLRTLLKRLNALLDENWLQSTQYLRRAHFGNFFLLLPWEYNFGVIFRALWALEDGKLELPTAFLAVQVTITHWLQIVAHISSTGQPQEFQHVEG